MLIGVAAVATHKLKGILTGLDGVVDIHIALLAAFELIDASVVVWCIDIKIIIA